MNTQSNAVPESLLGSQGIAPAAMSATRPMYWSVRRELWENRSIYIAPLAVASITLFGFLIATMGRAMSEANLAQQRVVLEEPFQFAMGVIMTTAFIVGIFYSLDALHGERRDRSCSGSRCRFLTSPLCCRRRAFRLSFCRCSASPLLLPRS